MKRSGRRRRPEISLGDLIRAEGALGTGTDSAERRAIAELLGLTPATGRRPEGAPTAPITPPGPPPAPRAPAREEPRRGPSVSGTASPEGPAPTPEPPADLRRRAHLESLPPASSAGGPPRRVADLDELLGDRAVARPFRARPAELFRPRWRRAILGAACATPAPIGGYDLDALVEVMALDHEVDELPRLPVPTVRRGVDLLLDYGEGMRPFAADRGRLRDAIRRLVDPDRLRVLRFAGSPLAGAGPGPRRTWRRYAPPEDGRPVVVASDLGLSGAALAGDPASVADWRRFGRRLAAVGTHGVVLVPFPADRWPTVDGCLALVHWDRATRLSGVRRCLAEVRR